MAAYYNYQLNYETCQATVTDLIGKSKISYYYCSKQGSVNSPSPLAAHGPSNPGLVRASHGCLPTEQHSSAKLIPSTQFQTTYTTYTLEYFLPVQK